MMMSFIGSLNKLFIIFEMIAKNNYYYNYLIMVSQSFFFFLFFFLFIVYIQLIRLY